VEGVEVALTAEEASERFSLPVDRIGDILVLGNEDAVFGSVVKGEFEDVDLRSHGSLHERLVPFIANKETKIMGENFNKDAFRILLSDYSF